VSCLLPEYAVGIRAFRTIMSDAFAQPRCYKDAIHGIAQGAWEYRTLTAGHAVPHGWRVVYQCPTHQLIKYTYWERITP